MLSDFNFNSDVITPHCLGQRGRREGANSEVFGLEFEAALELMGMKLKPYLLVELIWEKEEDEEVEGGKLLVTQVR